MQSPIWVRAREIHEWAGSPEGKALLPELVRRLVRATIPREHLSKCDFAAEAEMHRPGFDGTTATTAPTEFVPSGVTYWELGADASPEQKAEEDYQKRLRLHAERVKNGQADDITQTAFVAVTARDWHPSKIRQVIGQHGSQKRRGKKPVGKKAARAAKAKLVSFSMTDWAAAHSKEGKFKEVRAYDSNNLEQWLSEAPAVGLWLAAILGKSVEGAWGIDSHWRDVQEGLRKPLPPAVLLVDRESISQSFREWVQGAPRELAVSAPSSMELAAVFAAWAQTLADPEKSSLFAQAIVVEDRNTWRSLAESKNGLVLVAAPRLQADVDLFSRARRNGHWVLRHVDARSSRASGAIELPMMRTFHLERALEETKVIAEADAHQIARAAGGNFTILRRIFAKSPDVQSPPWSKETVLAKMLLAGAWEDQRSADQAILETLTGQTYEKMREVAALWRNEEDPPLRLIPVERAPSGVWEFNSPIDAWEILHHLLGPSNIAAFSDAAVEVLSEENPALTLPPEERPMAAVQGKVWKFSRALRQGLAEVLAILSSRQEESGTAAELDVAPKVGAIVKQLLPEGCGWRRWASLGNLLPSLIEAAPEEFLSIVENDLAQEFSQIVELLRNEIPPEGVSGAAYHSGLLWALESAAWSPENYRRVALILTRLTDLDPGGRWANRPAASAERLFFSARPQTLATIAERINTLTLICSTSPQAGWKFCMALMPRDSWSFSDNSMPRYRSWAAGWEGNATYADYDTAAEAVIGLAIELAEQDVEHWPELLRHVGGIFVGFPKMYERLFTSLESALLKVGADEKSPKLWEELTAIGRQHEQYIGAPWAMPAAELGRFRGLLDKIAPRDEVLINKHLFDDSSLFDGDDNLSYEDKAAQRDSQRCAAVRAIWNMGGIEAIERLVNEVANPFAAGRALAKVELTAFPQVIPAWLGVEQDAKARVAIGFASEVLTKNGLQAAEEIPSTEWSVEQKAAWSLVLPFTPRTWLLVDKWGMKVDQLYWSKVNPWIGEKLSLESAINASRRLRSASRPLAALELLIGQKKASADVAVDELIAAMEDVARTIDRPFNVMGAHYVREAFKILQTPQAGTDSDKVAALEFTYLPLLGSHFLLPTTLMWKLASTPSLFIECLTLLYKPHSEIVTEAHSSESDAQQVPEAPSDKGAHRELELKKARAQRVWKLLHDWNILPGTTVDNGFNDPQFADWLATARSMAKEVDRLEVCDVTLGQLFAKSPADFDGAIPRQAVREALEKAKSSAMERGLIIGLHNARGTFGKDLYEGGDQERKLAAEFERQAKICSAWPRTARALRSVAKDYLKQAAEEDERAKARR